MDPIYYYTRVLFLNCLCPLRHNWLYIYKDTCQDRHSDKILQTQEDNSVFTLYQRCRFLGELSSLSRLLTLEYLNWQGINFLYDAALARSHLFTVMFSQLCNVRIHKIVTSQLAIDPIFFNRFLLTFGAWQHCKSLLSCLINSVCPPKMPPNFWMVVWVHGKFN